LAAADAHNVNRSVDSYLDYIHSSLGEFAVCKNVFVATNSGWFAVRGLADAAQAIRSIVTDYSLHSQAARKIALEYLDAKIVLGRFLGELGI